MSLSVTSRRSVEAAGWIELDFLAWRLLSTRRTQCYEEIQVSRKIRVLPSGTHTHTRLTALSPGLPG